MQINVSSRASTAAWLTLITALLLVYSVFTHPVQNALMRLLPLIFAVVFLLSCSGWGGVFAKPLLGEADAILKQVTYCAMGSGATAMFVLLAGLPGYLNSILFLCWITAGLILFLVRTRSLSPGPIRFELNTWNSIAFITIFVFVLFAIPHILSPEISSDALSYHLLVPQLYLNLRKITPIPLLTESNYPFLAEYNYLIILSLTNEITCKSFHFLQGLLVLATITCLLKQLRAKDGSLLASAFFISMPVVAVQLGWAWNDFFFSLYVLLSLCFLLCYEQSGRSTHLVLAGLLAGFAGCTKYTVILFLPAFAVILLHGISKKGWRNGSSLYFLIPFVAVSLTWAIKNWIFTGNPVFPFFNYIFHSPSWSDAQQQYYSQMITRFYIPDWKWYSFILFPFLLMMKPQWADIHTGLLPLLFLPFLFKKRPGTAITSLKIFVFVTFFVWLLLQTGIRTLFPSLAVLFALYSIELYSSEGTQRQIWTVSIVTCLALNFIVTRVNIDYVFNPFPFSVGLESTEGFLKRISNGEKSYAFVNSQPKAGRVLLVSMHDPLHLKRQVYFSGRFDRPVAEVVSQNARTEKEIVTNLQQLGVTNVIVDTKAYELENSKKLYTWGAAQKKIFEDCLRQNMRVAGRFENVIVLDWRQP